MRVIGSRPSAHQISLLGTQEGLSEAWAVGGTGSMALTAFMFKSLVLFFENGKWLQKKSHFCYGQTGEPATVTDL